MITSETHSAPDTIPSSFYSQLTMTSGASACASCSSRPCGYSGDKNGASVLQEVGAFGMGG